MGHALAIALHSVDLDDTLSQEQQAITRLDPNVLYAYSEIAPLRLRCADILKCYHEAPCNQTGNYFISYREFCTLFCIECSDEHEFMMSQLFYLISALQTVRAVSRSIRNGSAPALVQPSSVAAMVATLVEQLCSYCAPTASVSEERLTAPVSVGRRRCTC